MLIQRSKPLGFQPPAQMMYPCPPPSHISHSDSLAVCVAHPSEATQTKGKTHEDAWPFWERGDYIKAAREEMASQRNGGPLGEMEKNTKGGGEE